MKILSVSEAQGQLSRLIAEVNEGEFVVLRDGDKEVTLHPGGALDLEQDSPELEAELLKAAEGPFKPYSPDAMQKICERIVEEKRRA
jgi:PHD/YefM family antitoxin component YafN of YafNO toxin-antitoxin module